MSNIDTSKWGLFKLSDFLTFETGRAKEDSFGKNDIVMCSGVNNGIHKTKKSSCETYENVITISKDGGCGEAFYQKDPVCVFTNVYICRLKDHKMNASIGRFLSVVITKQVFPLFNYGKKFNTSNGAEDVKIKLPLDSLGSIDFDEIESIMRKSEELKGNQPVFRTGVVDTSLWSKIKLIDLFDFGGKISRSKSCGSKTITGQTSNNGVRGVSDEYVAENVFTIASSGEYSGTILWHNYKINLGGNCFLARPKIDIPGSSGLFISKAITKQILDMKSKSKRTFTIKDASEKEVLLPIKNGLLDYEFIELFIESLKVKK